VRCALACERVADAYVRGAAPAVLLLCFLCSLAGCSRARPIEGTLTFKRDGRVVRTVTLAELAERAGAREVRSADPYYGAYKRFQAFPIKPALTWALNVEESALRSRAFMLIALDGYAVPIEGQRLLEDGAFVAVDDLDVPGFAPIGPRKVSPLPAYLIWEGTAGANQESHPRPWQLVAIDAVDPLALYPHTRPKGLVEGTPTMHGFKLFRERCIRCHAINREGGSVGPELNVPQSIVNYRPEAQIRAYIKNPLTFRYGTMPPHPDLTDADLDALIAYLQAIALEPHDPARVADPAHAAPAAASDGKGAP
jgi:mono/diheme cytochrome c family protein